MNRGAILALVLIALTGVTGSLSLYRMAIIGLERDQQATFTRLATARSGTIAQSLLLSQASAANILGLYRASDFVDPQEFESFSSIQHRRNTSIHALVWAPLVLHENRAAYEAQTSELLGTTYSIRELAPNGLLQAAQERAEYFPVQYVVPLKVNKTLVGFDLGSEPVRRNTMALARLSGLTRATPGLSLAQEIDTAPGILIMEPLYRGGRSTSTERQQNLQGFVIVVVRIKTLLLNAIQEVRQAQSPIYTALYDLTDGKEEFLYAVGDKPQTVDKSSWLQEETVKFSGRHWAIRNYPSRQFSGSTSWQPLSLLVGLLILTTIMLIFVYNLLHREQIVSQAVALRTRELRRSEARLRGLLDAANNPIFILDQDGRIESSNVAAQRIFTPGDDDMLPERFSSLFPDMPEERLLQSSNVELSIRTANGSTLYFESTVSATEAEGHLSRIAVLNDITVRRKMQRSEREQKQLFENIMQTMDEGLIVARSGHPLIVNRQTETLFPNVLALAGSRPVPNLAGWLDIETNEPILEESLPIHRIMRGEEVRNREYLVQNELHPTGVFIEVSGNALFDNERNRVGAMVVMRDITHRKTAEQKLQETANKLALSNQELESFARAASHDLQEPLRKVQRFGSLLRMTRAEQLDEQGLDFLDRMISAATRMSSLIEGLLSLARITSKARPFVPVNLEAILGEVLEDLQIRVEDTHAEIIHESLPTIDADPMQMRQLFQNLIGNGLKYQQEGNKPVIRIRAERTTLAENSERLYWLIHFSDNGIGFQQEDAEKIFGVFSRLHGRTEYEGSGVGLSICRKIAERHDGDIYAKSEPGQGATFTVLLPDHQISDPDTVPEP